jgi:hypothetical protein
MATKRALLVGINTFVNFPDAALRGCVNDVHDMVALLKDKFDFKTADIIVLTEAQATKAAIMRELNAMVADAKAGKLDTLVFTLSSHGTQVPDTSGDEKDKVDEAFCPYDLAQKGNKWHPDHIITDDELNKLFAQLPDNVTLEAFFDTCHSGTGVKDLWPVREFMPDEIKVGLPVAPTLRGVTKTLTSSSTTKKQRILWAGCKADQTSADAEFNGRPNGAFTFNYIKAIRETSGKFTREQIIAKMRAAMKDQFSQIPQLEADALNRTREIG